jgi:alkanesulfonate monooxygenase SsuD/methylene tetrahydromethanopterin reductase-like flavin-dependent oxidoreductase (luciferase family)
VRLCLVIEGSGGATWTNWVALAQASEDAELEGLFSSDHYRSLMRDDQAGPLDAWSTISALAAVTSRIRLGSLVSPVTFRPASVLAKNVVTADHISAGRVELGIGAGWFEAEHQTYGFRFGSVTERLEELERQLTEINRQWSTATDVWPKPVQQPRPPIIIGGRARPRTVRAAVAFADEYNTSGTVEEVRARRQRLDETSSAAGREPLRLSVMLTCVLGRDDTDVAKRIRRWRNELGQTGEPQICGTVETAVLRLREYEAAGADRAMLVHFFHDDVDMVNIVGELATRLR